MASLDYDDIQGILLQERPEKYVGMYLLLQIDDPKSGRSVLKKLLPEITSANRWEKPSDGAWVNGALTYKGLEKLGVPKESLESFPAEFREGMSSRAEKLGDYNESAPENWEDYFEEERLHLAIAIFSPDEERLKEALDRARKVYDELDGITLLYELSVSSPENGLSHMGFTEGISNPAIEGNELHPPLKGETPLKAGEFIIGKENEKGNIEEGPTPNILGNNGSYMALRKIHLRVAAFRSYLHEKGETDEERELLAAKMVVRWPSGTPLSLSPDKDDPKLALDENVRNDFLYKDDPKGLKCPLSSHVRRANPRDSLEDSIADVNIHRLLRRSTMYGPPLPEGELADDGEDRGLIFAGICTSLSRQYEFIKSTWLNDGNFIELSEEDPITGNKAGEGMYTIPEEPFRKRMHGIPAFSVTKGGSYFFIPSISALKWISELGEK